jgi:CHASE2 domain-containing sensor protein
LILELRQSIFPILELDNFTFEKLIMGELTLPFEYHVGGSLNSDAPSYVIRQADGIFYDALKAGQFCYVLNSRQMGKSSLRVRTMQKLKAEGIVCIFIDLMGIGIQEVKAEQWYAGIVQSLVSNCELSIAGRWRAWWREKRDLLSPVQRLSLFIKEVLLAEVQQNIVIFVDEIDQVLSQSFCLDDFFMLIRFFWEQRNIDLEYRRLTFCLLGVATPSSLIQSPIQTPFNIGVAIELNGFTIAEVQPLIKGLEGSIHHPQDVLQAVLDWTGGQPFLTQKLCYLLKRELKIGKSPILQSPEQIVAWVEQVVKAQIVDNWEAKDEPEHIKTIQDRILKNDRWGGRLLGLYKRICQQGKISYDNSPEQRELRLSGLVVKHHNDLEVYNKLYGIIFDEFWVQSRLNALRPYADTIASWSSSPDEKFLLRGDALQDALRWSLGKSLSDADYQFLGASQELAKRQAQSNLEEIEQANQLLVGARRQAKIAVSNSRLPWPYIPKVAFGITAILIILRLSGLLQGLEWNLLDRFFCWRSPEDIDKRIALVTISESDISYLGHWPLTDQKLAQVLATIKAQTPQAIGVDLYRNLRVEPGHQALTQLMQSTPNLFGIEKVIDPSIAPHPVLKQHKQVGFSDQVLDGDGILRRALLSTSSKENEVQYSLALKLVLNYLEAHKITLQSVDNDSRRLKLGKAIFTRFEANDGGYVGASTGGYQILLNFRGNQGHFLTFPLKSVLENQIPSHSFSSRLVLIGSTAESLRDEFYTPYSHNGFGLSQTMPGVVVHANIISQILSAALNGRPLLNTWSEPLEALCILLTAHLGAAISWGLRSSKAIAIVILALTGGLIGISYLAFLQGWWLPIIPVLLSSGCAAAIIGFITAKQRERLLLESTLDWLIQLGQDFPNAERIAIEYLKQSESKENQSFIHKKLEIRHNKK